MNPNEGKSPPRPRAFVCRLPPEGCVPAGCPGRRTKRLLSVTAFFATPPDIPPPVAMAVTIEPEGGVPAPTGDKYLVGAAH